MMYSKKLFCCYSEMVRSHVTFDIRILPLVFFIAVHHIGMANERTVLPSMTLDNPSGLPSLSGVNMFKPFKYIPPIDTAEPGGVDAPKLKPSEKAVADLYSAGDYKSAAVAGLILMNDEKVDDSVELMIGNSLAWTGRLNEAAAIYERLTRGKYADSANIGLANLQRWNGRDDIAAPIYESVLTRDPGNKDALSGLVFTGRELNPKTTLTLGGASDTSPEERRFATINHRWRNDTGNRTYEVETSKVKDELLAVKAHQQEMTLRFHDLNIPLKPRFEVSTPTGSARTLFANIAFSLNDDQTFLYIGRINWGRLAINPNALNLGLSAYHVGAVTWKDLSIGRLTGRINRYDISDGNEIWNGGLNLDAAWRPLGSSMKPFMGIEFRKAEKNAPSYWSPVDGSGTAYLGLKGEWSTDNWNIYSSAQLSGRLFGDAGNGWSFSAGGKRWLSNDVAMSMNLWSMASLRNNSAYRARSLSINLEKLWN